MIPPKRPKMMTVVSVKQNRSQNPSRMAKAVVALRRKIRETLYGLPDDQVTSTEWKIIKAYPQYFENDHGYIKVLTTGKRRRRNPEIMGRYVSEAVLDNVFKHLTQYYQSSARDKKNGLPNLIRYLELTAGISPRQAKAYIGVMQKHLMPRRNATANDFKQHQKVRLQDLVRKFQGHANGLKHRLLEADTAPKHKYLLGCLALMKVKANGKIIPIEFDGHAYLAADLRNNLHAVGKDAIISNVKKPNPGMLQELGKLVQIDYITAKSHIENGETVRFWHKLGEVDSQHPTLYIDHDGFPIINGGGYDIWDVGIVN